jgi:hypothetical protein
MESEEKESVLESRLERHESRESREVRARPAAPNEMCSDRETVGSWAGRAIWERRRTTAGPARVTRETESERGLTGAPDAAR